MCSSKSYVRISKFFFTPKSPCDCISHGLFRVPSHLCWLSVKGEKASDAGARFSREGVLNGMTRLPSVFLHSMGTCVASTSTSQDVSKSVSAGLEFPDIVTGPGD